MVESGAQWPSSGDRRPRSPLRPAFRVLDHDRFGPVCRRRRLRAPTPPPVPLPLLPAPVGALRDPDQPAEARRRPMLRGGSPRAPRRPQVTLSALLPHPKLYASLTQRGRQVIDLCLKSLHLRVRTRAATLSEALLAALQELPLPVRDRLLRHLCTTAASAIVTSPEITERRTTTHNPVRRRANVPYPPEQSRKSGPFCSWRLAACRACGRYGADFGAFSLRGTPE